MTIREYLKNPEGKGSAIHPYLNLSKDIYKKRLEIIRDKIKIKWYVYQSYLIAHLKIPSESVDNLYYDVVFQFDITSIANIIDAPFTVFSNCPSFTYSYAHAFYNKSLMCKWLFDKYDNQVKKEKSKVRNKGNVVGLEKSIFYAMIFISDNRNNSVENIIKNGMKLPNLSKIKNEVLSQNVIENTYKREKDRNDNIKDKIDKKRNNRSKENEKKKSKKSSRIIHNISKAKKTSSISKVSIIRKSKKI